MDFARIVEQAHLTPDRSAVVYNGRAYTYAHFARWIDGCRQYLAQQDLPSGSVAFFAERLVDGWVLGLALRSLGLNTITARNTETLHKLELRDISCMVTTTAEDRLIAQSLSANSQWRLIRIPADLEFATAQGSIPEAQVSRTRAGGHILLTSGTTGTYKKVMWSATTQALAIPLHAEINRISNQSVVYMMYFGLWTGAGYRWPLSTWTMGGTVVIHQAPDLHQPLVDHELTHICTTPSMLTELMRVLGDTPRRNDATRLTVVGSALPKALLVVAKERLTCRVYSGLASTEGMTLSSTPIEQSEDLLWHRIHRSREVQVVDEADNVLGPGRVGLVRVRIIDGIDGYLDDQAATRIFFRHGYFYTGDLGLFGDDGRLGLRGRGSDVINVLGNKIATGPMEQAVRDRLGVEDACIISIHGDESDDVVHLVIQSRHRVERAEVEAAVRAEMGPITRVRVRVSFTRNLPRNDLGKIQRVALRQLLIEAAQRRTAPSP